jgi:hypothetical protein
MTTLVMQRFFAETEFRKRKIVLSAQFQMAISRLSHIADG